MLLYRYHTVQVVVTAMAIGTYRYGVEEKQTD
jgi:hypothetical protein